MGQALLNCLHGVNGVEVTKQSTRQHAISHGQNAALLGSLSGSSTFPESESQPQPSRDLIDVVNILPQYGSVVAAARVFAFNDQHTKAIKGFVVKTLKVSLCQSHARELFRSVLASRIGTPPPTQ
jgi:hypothetical protein